MRHHDVFCRPRLAARLIPDDSIAPGRVAAKREFSVLQYGIPDHAQEPVRQHFARPHIAELGKRLPGLKIVAIAHKALQLLQCPLKRLETPNVMVDCAHTQKTSISNRCDAVPSSTLAT